MSGRPASPAAAQALRLEVLKELQQILENRDRVDKTPLAETKGREHWVLHLLLRAEEVNQAHFDTLIGTAYGNLLARFQALEDRIAVVEELGRTSDADARTRSSTLETGLSERVDRGLLQGTDRIAQAVTERFQKVLDERWRPVSDSIDTFAQGSKQILKDVADTYRVATQTRLLLNENARRIADLGRDLVALEESLKLVVQRTIEEALLPLEQRVAALEGHAPVAGSAGAVADPPPEKPPQSSTGS